MAQGKGEGLGGLSSLFLSPRPAFPPAAPPQDAQAQDTSGANTPGTEGKEPVGLSVLPGKVLCAVGTFLPSWAWGIRAFQRSQI